MSLKDREAWCAAVHGVTAERLNNNREGPEDWRGQAGVDPAVGSLSTHLYVVASQPRTSGPTAAVSCASGHGHQSHPAVLGAPWKGPTVGRLGGHRARSDKT